MNPDARWEFFALMLTQAAETLPNGSDIWKCVTAIAMTAKAVAETEVAMAPRTAAEG